mmetsp:Transcript_8228/g.24525  ORF Transcript_8228/g.24525 Transcript_8228/m.24525 type:complete len:242 (+) Transcript_8228:3402-4127(+)
MLSYKIFGFQNVVQEPQIIQELCTRIDAGILHKHNVVCDFILDHLADASIAAPAISATLDKRYTETVCSAISRNKNMLHTPATSSPLWETGSDQASPTRSAASVLHTIPPFQMTPEIIPNGAATFIEATEGNTVCLPSWMMASARIRTGAEMPTPVAKFAKYVALGNWTNARGANTSPVQTPATTAATRPLPKEGNLLSFMASALRGSMTRSSDSRLSSTNSNTMSSSSLSTANSAASSLC